MNIAEAMYKSTLVIQLLNYIHTWYNLCNYYGLDKEMYANINFKRNAGIHPCTKNPKNYLPASNLLAGAISKQTYNANIFYQIIITYHHSICSYQHVILFFRTRTTFHSRCTPWGPCPKRWHRIPHPCWLKLLLNPVKYE